MCVITFGKGVCVCVCVFVGGVGSAGTVSVICVIWSTSGLVRMEGRGTLARAHTHRKRDTHTHTHTHEALINLAVLAAAGPDFVPAKTDVGGSSTFSQSALIAGLRSPASLARCLSALYLPVRFDERLPRVGAAAPRRPAFCFVFFYFIFPCRQDVVLQNALNAPPCFLIAFQCE